MAQQVHRSLMLLPKNGQLHFKESLFSFLLKRRYQFRIFKNPNPSACYKIVSRPKLIRQRIFHLSTVHQIHRTSGKVLSSKTAKNTGRLSVAFRQAANAAGLKKDSSLGYFFRKMAYRKGRKAAITATARKLAVIVYHMLQNKTAYQPVSVEQYEQQNRQRKIKQVQKAIKNLGLKKEELAFT